MRALDRSARRHVYGLGRLPDGHPTGELGALASRPPRDGIPVWQTPDGRIVTDSYDALQGRARPLGAVSSALAPIRWSQHRRSVRARAVARRVAELAWSRRGAVTDGDGDRAGYLYRDPEAGTRPLYSALHPASGDQLLTTDRSEAGALGYVEATLLGHLRAAAPLTGALGLRPADVPWAREFGRAFQTQGGLLLGGLELPGAGGEMTVETARIAGWAVGIGDTVRCIEVFVDGKPIGRARLGLPRRDLVRHLPPAEVPDVVLAGFELIPSSHQLPRGAEPVTITAVVTSMAGGTLVLESNDVQLIRTRQRLYIERANGASAASNGHPAKTNPGRRPDPGGLLAFTHRLDIGGAQRYFVDQVLRLQRSGFENCTVVSFADGPWREVLERAGAEVHVTSAFPKLGPAEYEGRLEELRAWCEPRDHSVAFVNTLDCFMGADLTHRLGIPTAWALHESFDLATWWSVGHGWSPHHEYVFERLERSLDEVDATIFAADATRRLYEPYVDVNRAVLLPYGIEFEALDRCRDSFDPQAERRARGVPEDARVVLCMATMNSRKGQALLAQAFAAVAGDHPDAQLYLVGETPGPYPEAIRDYVAAMSLESRVRIEPATPDAYAWHLLGDVSALASAVESLPLSIIEAMALERPVVASRVFGLPELIEDGRSGFMFEPNDLGELASALDRVLRMDPADLRSVALAGSERVRERHDPDRYSEQFVDLLRSLESSRQLV
ncbi:MAG: D-inositol-3-phosphate glycosyltransferase [Thermoleophilaceae bacterium]|nr:D-inositol-3-phosphate glycosyltransferase [Thermoleophilaceae bacterium]